MIANLPFIAVALLIGIALATILLKKNMIKMVMGLAMLEGAVNLFLVSLGYRENGIAPIFTNAPEGADMVLPTVQALTLTNIVIGVATTALMLVLVMVIYKKYGTVNSDKIRRLKE
ncbi:MULTISPECIES: sodium:proton antiporter [Methanocorpusculum]|jgi:multicomponent Na+:H+ antiporter subunit C|uniref:sodium:proton antiporter n=1 Tax=Methanocorpusculum TaxID=2192 RepID=UPI0005B2949B|nr:MULTISPECIES: sodium:proton antiporter [Methanocorpusculum]MDD4423870.1 sodium:proton antiporter [Methanocorpusculum parvum]MDD2803665.1 sodium:proton antiporter [Methanocorpusculum sp.]MDD3913025.1 sodium:proton antiporter [Methanocorpusculum sp.]MEA5085818.1 sodium:proton antiporter [Methanocorpusculum sp.]NLC91590.1 cation:proton antiporter [Methanocorpusculum parvum]